MGEKWHCFAIHIPWYGIGTKYLPLVRETKSSYYGSKLALFCFSQSHGTGLAPPQKKKNRKKLSMMQNETP